MRHKWKNKIYKKKKYPYLDEECFYLKIDKTEECINCGLRKGKTRELRFYPVTVYFNENKVLSEKKIPYTCTGITGGEFFKESEFNL
jgi:hypothetical protein